MPALCWDTPKVGDLLPLEVANDRSPRGSSLAYVTENSCNCSFRNGWLAVFTEPQHLPSSTVGAASLAGLPLQAGSL